MLNKILTILIIILSIILVIFFYKYKGVIHELNIQVQNNKAYELENSELKNKANVFQLTIDQVKGSKDSVVSILNNVRKQLKIKNSKVKSLQYIETTTTIYDTCIFKDTIFKNISLNKDTFIINKYYTINLKLKYPDTIVCIPTVYNNQSVIFSYKKETVNSPKKCWLLRLFQKKHTVITADIVNSNPYILTNKSKFIDIIK